MSSILDTTWPAPGQPTESAVVVVDVQRIFTDLFPQPVSPPLDVVLPAMSRFLEGARESGTTVIFVRTIIDEHEHSANTLSWPMPLVSNVGPGSPGTEWDPRLLPQPGDLELVKRRYSSFFGTNLDDLLRSQQINTVVALGITTNICVQSTVRDAWQHGYATVTLSDCCSEAGEGAHEASLAMTARNFGTVCTSDELLAAWTRRPTDTRELSESRI